MAAQVNVSSNRRKWALLRQFPTTTIASLEAFWREDVRSPLLPPTPPPPPNPPPCAGTYGNCLVTQCCIELGSSCHRRPGKQYAQCRPPAAEPCVDSANWHGLADGTLTLTLTLTRSLSLSLSLTLALTRTLTLTLTRHAPRLVRVHEARLQPRAAGQGVKGAV